MSDPFSLPKKESLFEGYKIHSLDRHTQKVPIVTIVTIVPTVVEEVRSGHEVVVTNWMSPICPHCSA